MNLQEQVTRAYEETREDVYHYLLRFGLSPAEAQETAQEVFLRLYSAMRQGEAIRNLRAWAFRVAHNLGANHRAARDRWMPLDPALEARLPDAGPGPEAVAIDRQRARRIQEALAELSPQQRKCLYLRAEGLRYREIAETIGIGLSSVSEFVTRALVRLRKAAESDR